VEKRRRLRRMRRRQVRLGETIYKGHRSYDLMLNLQLGIRYTITTLNKLPPLNKPPWSIRCKAGSSQRLC
jgi:1-phosphatidylinositol-4-phosphate 5-kinase